MARTAKLFRNGRNQAVRIPRQMEIEVDQVYVTKRGDEVILSARPRDWSGLVESKARASSEFLLDCRAVGPARR